VAADYADYTDQSWKIPKQPPGVDTGEVVNPSSPRAKKPYTSVVDADIRRVANDVFYAFTDLPSRHRSCRFCSAMKPTRSPLNTLAAATLALVFSVTLSAFVPGNTAGQQKGKSTETLSLKYEKQLIADFNRHVKDYLKQRERVKAKLPQLSKDATPEQIDAYQKSFVEALRAMRAGTKQGYIFNREFANYLRDLIKTEFPPREKANIREVILEADTKGVPLRVNYPYPETKELAQIPPTLLMKLPVLPKEVKYRYVGRHMLLVDTDNGLIVDYMIDALP